MSLNYQTDCVHLKACRRLCKIAKRDFSRTLARGCNETCTAYEPRDEYVRYEQARGAIIDAVDALDRGESYDDVMAEVCL